MPYKVRSLIDGKEMETTDDVNRELMYIKERINEIEAYDLYDQDALDLLEDHKDQIELYHFDLCSS